VRLSAITDEISQDLDVALRVCDSLGVETVEVRTVGDTNIVDHDPAAVRRIGAAIRAGGFRCTVVDTPFLKTAAARADVPDAEWARLQRGIEAATTFEATTLRVFSGARPGASQVAPPNGAARWAADVLGRAADLARDAGLRVAMEIEWECLVGTGLEARAVLDAVADGDIGVVWDPGNEARLAGAAPDPDGYAAVRDRIVHVHVKDVDGAGQWTRVGDGIVDWHAELRRLAADGYDGLLSLETHYRDPTGGLAAATRECADALRELAARDGIAL